MADRQCSGQIFRCDFYRRRRMGVVPRWYRCVYFIFMLIVSRGFYMTAWADSPYGELSELEKHVLLDKGTERAFTGKYTDEFGLGVYACRHCGAPLYRSDDKFRSSCGWPSFDDSIGGAFLRRPDADGKRTEIVCRACGGHLGHVFEGEQATEKDTRFCVNSVSLVFEPQNGGRLARAVFAGGCFWGVEELMRSVPGVLTVTSGYTGGRTMFPTYEEVCAGRTGHAEAVEIVYDTAKTDYRTLCQYFLEIHDPTEKNRQGPDVGIQYRSAIFWLDENQRDTARSLLQILHDQGLAVQTQVSPFDRFWQAEDYHQDYYQRKGTAPYCHRYTKRF